MAFAESTGRDRPISVTGPGPVPAPSPGDGEHLGVTVIAMRDELLSLTTGLRRQRRMRKSLRWHTIKR